jgi:hypothetical protein
MLLHLRFETLPKTDWESLESDLKKSNVNIHQWNRWFGARMVNLGFDVRARGDTSVVQMLPYVLLDCDINDVDFWTNDSAQVRSQKHRRIFHIAVGSYLPIGSKSEHIPAELRPSPKEDLLGSLSWSEDSLLFGYTRGSGILFRSAKPTSEWPAVKMKAYRKAILDTTEQAVGMWSALGTLNVHLDGVLRRIGGKPLENEPALSEVESVRTILTFLLGEPSMYQIEGGSILTFQDTLRKRFGIDYLRDLLFRKFESVKDLHDLQMHLEALRQIQKENAPYDRR